MPIDVLMLQLGTPSEPTARGLRPYLREFLMDPRVIELPALPRWMLVNLVIAPFRSISSAKKYRRIWDNKTGSPLLDITRRQTQALANALGAGYRVRFAMRYGSPSVPEVISQIMADGSQQLFLLPMFPQYSATTTASALDAVFASLANHRVVPSIRAVRDYHKDPGYISAVAAGIRKALAAIESESDRPNYFLVSFHGIPKSYIERGDVYEKQSRVTAELLAQQMGWSSEQWRTVFQSRLGRQEWLVPYTDETLRELGAKGIKKVLIVQPGFTADCLETIDEIGNEGSHDFRSSGGETLLRVPCSNDSPEFITALANIVFRETRGWA